MKKSKPRKPGKRIVADFTKWSAVTINFRPYYNPKELRKLAAWLVRAADWIEGQEGKK